MPKTPQLVCQHLENISGDVLEDYQDIIREYVARRQGVYALYDDDQLYYAGGAYVAMLLSRCMRPCRLIVRPCPRPRCHRGG
jgi:hypothetical protein